MAVPVSLHDAIAAVHHHVVSNIKFPSLIEKRPLDVLLKNVGLQSTIAVHLLGFEDGLDLAEVEADCDSVAAICVLSRFDDPGIELMNRI